MVLERELIQSRGGFRNVQEGTDTVGFELALRMPNYRASGGEASSTAWLSPWTVRNGAGKYRAGHSRDALSASRNCAYPPMSAGSSTKWPPSWCRSQAAWP